MLRGSVPSTQSRAQHKFSMAPQVSIPRSKFNRSFTHKTTFSAGYLVPILVDEMLPGDTFNCQMHAFARMNTPLFPIMDNLYLETFFFAVPYRLVWTNWQKFNGEQTNPGDSTSFTIPYTTAPAVGGVAEASLCDYMGIPTAVNSLQFDSLHLRAYNLIYNQWFRDENLQNSVAVPTGDGPDTYTDFTLLRRGKRHDYFTSCLPWPAKPADVSMFAATAQSPVIGDGTSFRWKTSTDSSERLVNAGYDATIAVNNVYLGSTPLGANGNAIWAATDTGLLANLSAATNATINDLRLAFQTQRYYEKNARSGTRYTEIIKGHFGVDSPDMRLQRPEYLGGGSSPVIINPVAQTSATTGTQALGELAAYGVCAPVGHGFVYSATEHCLILGLVSVRADLNYQRGLERMWSRRTLFDFYWPTLAHLGEQAVLNKEIYAQGTADDNLAFGYQERYAEYRYKPSLVTGLFRSQATGSLDGWHLAQDFSALPLLNSTFIQENPPMSRIMAVTTEPDFLLDSFFSYYCARPMPVYSVPGLVDHF